MSFGAPQWFWGLLAIPVLVGLFVRAEQRAGRRLQEFVSARLLPQLAGTVNRFRRALRFAFLLLGLALAIASLAQPRWGYTYEDVKRKGLDLFIAVDTSRSMLSNDVQPNRLERVKLATQDLIDELQGDRVGLIAFAGRAFVQAPLTIDYDAAVESINDLDTKTIPEGGTNISEAITLAENTFGKSAIGNRALIIFTDGEELSGDAVKAAKTAADAGIRIFTVGVGTPQGSLIPVPGEDGGTAFVKDSSGRVVKSKLDDKRLREIAEATGGLYLHLENGPHTMKQLYSDGLAKMQAAEINGSLSRRPIERYEWPLAMALFALAMSMLIGERKRLRVRARFPQFANVAVPATASAFLIFCSAAHGAVRGVDLYRDGKFADAYRSFEDDLQDHPNSPVRDKMQFDVGTAAYKMRDYNKALESFSAALLSNDKGLQENSHFNLGRTLEERADFDKTDAEELKDLEDAQSHYEQALKLNPGNQAAKANLEEVKKKIERLKKHPKQKPTTPPSSQQQKKDKDQQGGDQQQNQQQQDRQQQQQQNQQSQAQNKSGNGQNQKQESNQGESQAKNEQQKNQEQKPAPSPGTEQQQGSSGENQADQSPSPGQGKNEAPSPSPGEGEGSKENPAPPATPAQSPQKKFGGEIKGAPGERSEPPDRAGQLARAEPEKDGQMSEQQAERLLQSMKDEEERVQLDERRPTRHVYNDW